MTALTDRIAAAICEHREYFEFDLDSDYPACSCGWEWDGTPFSRHLAAVVAAVVYPCIDTVDELDSLPEDSVINDAHGCTAKKQGDAWWWVRTTDPFEPDLPAIVLWQPEDSDG